MEKIVNSLILLPALSVFPAVTLAVTQPVAQNTVLTMGFDRASMPSTVVIWDKLPGGYYDENNSPKGSNNSLVCQSRSDAKYGACLTFPVLLSAAVRPTKITLNFTLAGTSTVVPMVIEGRKLGDNCTSNGSGEGYPCPNLRFTLSIPQAELKKINRAGRWTATLKQDLMAWPIGFECTGDQRDPAVGCTNASKIHTWSAKITFNVTDYANQQIYLPAFPISTPVINLNLNTRPGTSSSKTVNGSTSLDMCLYDGSDSISDRISLQLRDEGATAPGRTKGQFSLYRRGGDKAKAGDRLDYQVSVINPTTGAVQEIANGTEIIWSETNRRNIQRMVVLPGGGAPVLCVPAPLTLTTPAFSIADKTAGDYIGKLRIIYTPSTQTAP